MVAGDGQTAGRRASGSAPPGPSYWVQEENEFVHILSGSLTVTPDGGSPRKLGPGDAAVFPRGWRGTWDLHETVRKVYVIF